MGRRVRQVTRTASGFRVDGTSADGAGWSLGCDQVVNALWDGRLAIDGGLGLRPDRPWVHRLKYRVMVTLPDRLRGRPPAVVLHAHRVAEAAPVDLAKSARAEEPASLKPPVGRRRRSR